ncbi:MAG: nicotinate-nucleotide adenylyltransferase [Deltaproteobacteria bacterium]|nr:nicotinate-nucleotide adenylyltransferase [Deltaproteobacteria bacterium]
MTETGVVHGRFQIMHNDHMKYLMAGKSKCRHLVVGITNPDPTLSGKDVTDPARNSADANPFTYYERYQMVKITLLEQGLGITEFSVVSFPINFPDLYKYYVPLNALFFLTIYDGWGEKKLKMLQSQSLKTEILWRRPIEEKGLSSTYIRELICRDEPWEHLVPPAACHFLKAFDLLDRLKNVYHSGPG